MTQTNGSGKRARGLPRGKIVVLSLALSVGYFLWRFVGNYSNNIYIQNLPSTAFLADFWLTANLAVIAGLTITLIVLRFRRTVS